MLKKQNDQEFFIVLGKCLEDIDHKYESGGYKETLQEGISDITSEDYRDKFTSFFDGISSLINKNVKKRLNCKLKYNGYYVLEKLCSYGFEETASLLVQNGVDPNSYDKPENAPVLTVKSYKLFKELVDKGANLDLSDHNTPAIFILYLEKQTKKFEAFFNNGADLDLTDENGNTLAMLCVVKKDKLTLNKLVKKGVNLDIANNKNRTVFDIAEIVGDELILDYLKPYKDVNNRFPNTFKSDYSNSFKRQSVNELDNELKNLETNLKKQKKVDIEKSK